MIQNQFWWRHGTSNLLDLVAGNLGRCGVRHLVDRSNSITTFLVEIQLKSIILLHWFIWVGYRWYYRPNDYFPTHFNNFQNIFNIVNCLYLVKSMFHVVLDIILSQDYFLFSGCFLFALLGSIDWIAWIAWIGPFFLFDDTAQCLGWDDV